VTTSPIQNRGQFAAQNFGQRQNSFGLSQNYNFPSAQQSQRQNPYLDTTGFGEVIIGCFISYLASATIGTVFLSVKPQNALIIFSAKIEWQNAKKK
jgi:hypothetical protein